VDFEPIESTAFGSAAPSVLFYFDNQGVRDTDIIVNTYRKTVDTINGLKVQFFYGLSRVKEKFAKEFPDLRHSSIETTFAKHMRYKPCTADKAKGFFNIPCKVSAHKQYDCDDFRIGCFPAFRFFISSKNTYIATVLLTMVNLFYWVLSTPNITY
jgi:hypothetical protein